MRLSIVLSAFVLASAYNPLPMGIVWIACIGMILCFILDMVELNEKKDKDKQNE